MDLGSPADSHSDAFPEGNEFSYGPDRILGPDKASIVFADAGFRNRLDQSPPAPRPRDPRATLAEKLTPLLGDPATPVADLLIKRFGTIARVLSASPEALRGALHEHQHAADAICAARTLMKFAIHEQLVGQVVDTSERRLHDYLKSELLNPAEERLHAIFLDSSSRFLAAETVSRGSSGRVSLHIRHLMHRALDLAASQLLLAHNHPSGSCRPSNEDRSSTRALEAIANALDLHITDHLIVSTGGIYSMTKGKKL